VSIDRTVLGRVSPPVRREWNERDTLLYAVSVGAGLGDPSAELSLSTENTAGVRHQVLPTFATALVAPRIHPVLKAVDPTWGSFEAPYGNSLVGSYAMAAQRHMHEYGTTPEQLAAVAVGVREFAAYNPNAMYREPLTIADVLESRLIADPLHKLDCCVISDGGGALLMTTEERARDLRQPPVYVLGTAAGQTHWNISQMPDFTSLAAAPAGAAAYSQAGILPEDVDMVMFYDSFTITCVLLLEALGFCKRGEGGPLVADGNLRMGGRLPMNTDGGGLSACHPGMRGLFLLAEAVRQLRGDAGEVQVPDCEIAVAAGSGGWLSTMGVTVLGRQAPA
jgi:acetyl-CoA acetyltransferase